jgi:hypothetical protein
MATDTAELIDALRRRIAVIGDRALREADSARHLDQLRAASEHLTALQAQLPPDTHPQLRHFFERCSYDKALAWLEERGLDPTPP